MSSMVTVFGKGNETLKALWEKRSSKSSVDVTLLCIGDYMYCHRKPMIEASPKFKKMLSDCPSVLNLGIKAHEALFLLNVVYGLTFSFPSDLMPRFFSLLNTYEVPHPPVHVSVGPLITTDAGGSSGAVARIAKLINQENLRNELNFVKSVNIARKVSKSGSSVAKKSSRLSDAGSTMCSDLGGNVSGAWSRALDKGAETCNSERGISNEPPCLIRVPVPTLPGKSPVAKKLLPTFKHLGKETLPANLLHPYLYQVPSKTTNEKANERKYRSITSLRDLYYEGALVMDNSTERSQKTGRAVSSRLQREMAECGNDQYLLPNRMGMSCNDKYLRKGMHISDRSMYGGKYCSNVPQKAVRSVTSDSLLQGEMAECVPDKYLLRKVYAMSKTKLAREGMHLSDNEKDSCSGPHKAVGSPTLLQRQKAESFPDRYLLTNRKVINSEKHLSREGMHISNRILYGGDSFNGPLKARVVSGYNPQREQTKFDPDQHLQAKGKVSSSDHLSKEGIQIPDRILKEEKDSFFSGESIYKEGVKTRISSEFHFRGNMGRRNFCFFNNRPGSCIWCPHESDEVSSYSWDYDSNSVFSSRRDCTDSFSCSSCFDGELFMKSFIWDNEDGMTTCAGDDLNRYPESSIPDLLSGGKSKSTSNPWYCDILEKELKLLKTETLASRKDVLYTSDPANTTDIRNDTVVGSAVDRTNQMCFGGDISLPPDLNLFKKNSTELVEGIRIICKPEDEVSEDRAGKMGKKMGDHTSKMGYSASKKEDRTGVMEYSASKKEDRTSVMEYRASKIEDRTGVMEYSANIMADKMEGSSKKECVAEIPLEELKSLADQNFEEEEEEDEEVELAFRSPKSETQSEFTMDHLHEDTNAFEKWWKCLSQHRELADGKFNTFDYKKCPGLDELRVFKEWECKTNMMINSVLGDVGLFG